VAVRMELVRIVMHELADQQLIYLKEVGGERAFPIVIGAFEAASINRGVKGERGPRPLTHDLLIQVIRDLGGELDHIFINDLREHTYFAKLVIRRDGETIEVDSRPSDAIAVAVRLGVPIYVDEDVLEQALNSA
jgi:bifunctional DNase/RNase